MKIDIEIVVSPQPYTGVARHIGRLCDADNINDNMAIASTIRKIADELDPSDHDQQRKAFEQWISSPPYERSVERFQKDESKSAWPGQYKDNNVQVAWESWQMARGIEVRDSIN